MITIINIIDELETLRKELGIKQCVIAKELKVSQATYSRWINDKKFPRKTNFIKIKALVERLSKEKEFKGSNIK